jgi:catechol 2,3-dioxygenase-like lactoylglutathione lyase family enzyme
MMMPPRLYFVMLYVADLDAALDYFTDTLGFEREPSQDTPIFHYLRSGEGGIDFALRQSTPDSAAPGAVELYFQTADLATLRDAWVGRGVAATEIMPRPFGAIFSVQAPDQHLLTVVGAGGAA